MPVVHPPRKHTDTTNMVVYDSLSRVLPLRRRYALKFLAVAFIGIHIPLIGTAIYFAISPSEVDKLTVIVFILGLTLVATALTLVVLNKLLAPLNHARQSLDIYLTERRLPPIPLQYEDEVGQLLKSIHRTVERMDNMLVEKTGVIDLLSHDLRSPVTRIIGLSQVQKIDFISGNNNIYADEIIAECNDVLTLLNDVLMILRQEEMSSRNLQLVSVSLAEMVRRCMASYDVQSNQKSIRWDVDVESAHNVELEPTLFAQAFKNVIGNAIKFSQPGGNISVQSRISGGLLYLDVSDSGVGFDPRNKDEIFMRFTKAGNRGTAGEPSTGLGLYLSKRLIQMMGGNLIAESNGPGTGATFTFILQYQPLN